MAGQGQTGSAGQTEAVGPAELRVQLGRRCG